MVSWHWNMSLCSRYVTGDVQSARCVHNEPVFRRSQRQSRNVTSLVQQVWNWTELIHWCTLPFVIYPDSLTAFELLVIIWPFNSPVKVIQWIYRWLLEITDVWLLMIADHHMTLSRSRWHFLTQNCTVLAANTSS